MLSGIPWAISSALLISVCCAIHMSCLRDRCLDKTATFSAASSANLDSLYLDSLWKHETRNTGQLVKVSPQMADIWKEGVKQQAGLQAGR